MKLASSACSICRINLWPFFFFWGIQSIQQQSSSETEEGGNAADGSSEGEEGDSVGEEDEKEKLKGDKTGSKRKKTATSKVLHAAGGAKVSLSSVQANYLLSKHI